jgi:hypothetical protein
MTIAESQTIVEDCIWIGEVNQDVASPWNGFGQAISDSGKSVFGFRQHN